jgi:hypothetical protein
MAYLSDTDRASGTLVPLTHSRCCLCGLEFHKTEYGAILSEASDSAAEPVFVPCRGNPACPVRNDMHCDRAANKYSEGAPAQTHLTEF